MPQIFEFHFNPPDKKNLGSNKDDLMFDSFCFEPKNVYEKRMGSLYMAGLLKNVLPHNARFLEILAEKIKEKYYKAVSLSPEKALKEALRIANEHFEKTAKEGDVSWLGNLSFVTISLKNFELNFTKIGDLKILLMRDGQIIDIDQKLTFDEIEPYPLKIFGNIVSGKLTKNDILLILNKEVYEIFLKENLLSKTADIKNFKKILNDKKEQLTKTSGFCFLIALTEEIAVKEKEIIDEKKSLKPFSFKKAAKEFLAPFSRIKRISFSKIKLPRISLPRIRISYRPPSSLKRGVVLVLILILLLTTGFFVFEKREEEKARAYQAQIEEIAEKLEKAESQLDLAEYNPEAEKTAKMLFEEVWNETSSFITASPEPPSIVVNQLQDFKNKAEKSLYQMNKLLEITEPELVFEFKAMELVPQKMILFEDKLYFYTARSESIFELKNEEGKIMEVGKKINLASPFSDQLLFFSEPNKIISLKENNLQEPVSLQKPDFDFSFIDFSSYRSNLYFLDKKNSQIIVYPFLSELNWENPKSWLAPEIKIATDSQSMAIDGSIWILSKNGIIERYYLGKLQETIEIDVFPYIKNFSNIFTNLQLPYLYILEPEQKRLVVLDKTGRILSQYQSQKFNNLLDFAVSQDGKTIWLLNGLKVYKISEVI